MLFTISLLHACFSQPQTCFRRMDSLFKGQICDPNKNKGVAPPTQIKNRNETYFHSLFDGLRAEHFLGPKRG